MKAKITIETEDGQILTYNCDGFDCQIEFGTNYTYEKGEYIGKYNNKCRFLITGWQGINTWDDYETESRLDTLLPDTKFPG